MTGDTSREQSEFGGDDPSRVSEGEVVEIRNGSRVNKGEVVACTIIVAE